VDLDVTDAEAAARFYGGIFGWRRAEAPKNAGYSSSRSTGPRSPAWSR
jgi:predicted enzyme related to lactoylglutathione lyase